MHFQGRFLLHVCILIVVTFHLLPEKTLCFAGFLLSFFLLLIRAMCFNSVYPVKQDFFLQSRQYVSLENKLEIFEIFKLCGSDFIYV